jgi:hypothetical protein
MNGVESVEPMAMPLAIGLLCLSVIFIVIPIGVGFFALRKKPGASTPVSNEVIPPAI